MSLQFTPLDDAFSPLSVNKRKRRANREEINDTDIVDSVGEAVIVPRASIHSQPNITTNSHNTLLDDIINMQPYLCLIFMIVVAGMLYDIRNAILDMKNILRDISIKRGID